MKGMEGGLEALDELGADGIDKGMYSGSGGP